jgi:hypothetical protein
VSDFGFKYRLTKLRSFLRHSISHWYHNHFNPTVKQQLKDYKCIPIIIISYNQLHYLKQLIDFLLKNHYSNIVIIDNHSTYPPLLNYFDQIEDSITIHKLDDNAGHLSFWKHQSLFNTYSKGYYAVTDPDIVPIAECPGNFVQTFRVLLDKAYDRTKVGLSLKLEDIPDTNPNKKYIVDWESQYWTAKIHPQAYKAEIDTTFALYRPGYSYKLKHFTKAWRTDYPLQAKHGGWYLDLEHLTKEQRYYMKTANDSASWQINEAGELINKTHKPLYSND